VIVDETPTAPNVKQRTWEAFALLAGQVPQLLTPQLALIALDYSPFPQAMVQKIKQQAEAAQPANPAPPPGAVEQAQAAELMASAQLKGVQAQHLQRQDSNQMPVETLRSQSAQVRAQADALGAVAGMHKAAAEIVRSTH
jgi:hypothetical protein